MSTPEITRRAFTGALAAAGLPAASPGDWADLFDGRSLEGWRPSEHRDSWKVLDGQLAADGPRSHLFYAGPVNGAGFRNFELEVEALASPACNSGVYFHTAYQEQGWPQKGFEVQVNNTATGEGSYRERKKTGSLYGVRNLYKQFVKDGEWFTLRIAVRGKNIRVHLNGMLVVDYTEPSPPIIASGNERGRFLDRGTFALQCHDAGSKARYRRIRVRPLPDDAGTPDDAPAPLADELARDVITLGSQNIPLVDYHVHLKSGLSLEQALAHSRRCGIQYGIAINCGKGFPVEDEETAARFVAGMAGQPVFAAMQAEGREWTQMFSRRAVALFDYVFTDSMTWTDNRGRRMRTWIPEEVGAIADPQEFMEMLVDRAVGILEREPVDIYVNPTFLPDAIAADYDRLWTEERMGKVIAAAHRNQVAIEINNRYKLPSPRFLRLAKEAGCKFAFGTNNGGVEDLGRCEYAIRMTKELKLSWQDFFVPGVWWPKAVERKPEALRA
jgi:histidinol phosphatase-like PHP family hydrolase